MQFILSVEKIEGSLLVLGFERALLGALGLLPVVDAVRTAKHFVFGLRNRGRGAGCDELNPRVISP